MTVPCYTMTVFYCRRLLYTWSLYIAGTSFIICLQSYVLLEYSCQLLCSRWQFFGFLSGHTLGYLCSLCMLNVGSYLWQMLQFFCSLVVYGFYSGSILLWLCISDLVYVCQMCSGFILWTDHATTVVSDYMVFDGSNLDEWYDNSISLSFQKHMWLLFSFFFSKDWAVYILDPFFGFWNSPRCEYTECNFDLERWIKITLFFLGKKIIILVT